MIFVFCEDHSKFVVVFENWWTNLMTNAVDIYWNLSEYHADH